MEKHDYGGGSELRQASSELARESRLHFVAELLRSVSAL